LPVTLEQDDALGTIRLEGAVDIGCAAELKEMLLDALASGKEVRVALDGATGLDVTAIQLLWAAERAAKGAGIGFAIEGQTPEPVLAALADAGFEGFPFSVQAG